MAFLKQKNTLQSCTVHCTVHRYTTKRLKFQKLPRFAKFKTDKHTSFYILLLWQIIIQLLMRATVNDFLIRLAENKLKSDEIWLEYATFYGTNL